MADVSATQALAAATEGLAVLAAKKQRADLAGGNPAIDAQLDALFDAAALIARDARKDS